MRGEDVDLLPMFWPESLQSQKVHQETQKSKKTQSDLFFYLGNVEHPTNTQVNMRIHILKAFLEYWD